jgi:hypothetical protein
VPRCLPSCTGCGLGLLAVLQLLAITAFMIAFPPLVFLHAGPVICAMPGPAVRRTASRAGINVKGLWWTTLLFLPLFSSFTLFTLRNVPPIWRPRPRLGADPAFPVYDPIPIRGAGACGGLDGTLAAAHCTLPVKAATGTVSSVVKLAVTLRAGLRSAATAGAGDCPRLGLVDYHGRSPHRRWR